MQCTRSSIKELRAPSAAAVVIAICTRVSGAVPSDPPHRAGAEELYGIEWLAGWRSSGFQKVYTLHNRHVRVGAMFLIPNQHASAAQPNRGHGFHGSPWSGAHSQNASVRSLRQKRAQFVISMRNASQACANYLEKSFMYLRGISYYYYRMCQSS